MHTAGGLERLLTALGTVTHGMCPQLMALPSPWCLSCFPRPRPGSPTYGEASGGAPHCRLCTRLPDSYSLAAVSSFAWSCRTEESDTQWTGSGQEEKETPGPAGRAVPSPSRGPVSEEQGDSPVPGSASPGLTGSPCSAVGTFTSASCGPPSVYVGDREDTERSLAHPTVTHK